MTARRVLLTVSIAWAGALVLPGLAIAALQVESVRVTSAPATIRVFVQFTGDPPLTGLERQTDTLDPQPLDGRAVVRVNATGIRTGPAPTAAAAAGLQVRISQRPGNLVILLDSAANRLKFVSYRVSVPRNLLIIDLWRVTTAGAARVLDDRCLRMTRWTSLGARATARGLERVPLFEHGLVLTLRGAGGAVIAEKPLIATEGTFRPDFSGYSTPGTWRGSMPYSVGTVRRAMLEAWSASAKDGSLDCLVQTPVILR